MTLSERVALVTGGGTGIGKGITEALAKNGARVAIASRNPSHLEPTAKTLQACGYEVVPISIDVREKKSIQSGIAKIGEIWGRIDILVNNAGVSGRSPIDDPDDSKWYDILETNLSGAFLVTKEVRKVMHDHAGGRIINVSSVLGKFGVPGYSAYCTSEHGLIGFTRALALELADRRITVNAICPGWVDTAMARQGIRESASSQGIRPEEFCEQAVARVPLQRFIKTEEVAELVLYLASDKAGGITGQGINICGGQTMV